MICPTLIATTAAAAGWSSIVKFLAVALSHVTPNILISSRFQIVATIIWHFGAAPSSAAIEGRGLDNCKFVSRTLLLV